MVNKINDILNKNNLTIIDTNELKALTKDRLDFGFDSIYFRYAAAVEELAVYKAFESAKRRELPLEEAYQRQHQLAENNKMHFYNALEQLIHAH